jgi:hypothetical protein
MRKKKKNRAGFYGASIAAGADLWEPHAYPIGAAQLDDPEHNVILVRDDVLRSAAARGGDRARAAALVPGAFPTDVCTLYYAAMAPNPAAGSPGYHCIHACEDDSPNYDDLEEGKFDVTKAWQTYGLGAGRSAEQVRSLVHGVFAAAAADHEARMGGRNAFSVSMLRHLDPAACGAGLPTARRWEKFVG